MTPEKGINLDIHDQIAWITILNNVNSSNTPLYMASLLRSACQRTAQENSVRAVIITGSEGKFFAIDKHPSPQEIRTTSENFSNRSHSFLLEAQMAQTIANLKMPIIAAINGPAIGQGLEIALACDIRVASTEATFQLPQINFGFMPWDGGTQRLPRIVGRSRALELLLTGREVDATEALNISLVHEIIEGDQLRTHVQTLAESIIQKAPIATRYAKEAILKGMDLTLEAGMRMEADLNFLLHNTFDRDEGINSFREHRPPRFKGV